MRTKVAGAILGAAVALAPFVSSAASLTADQQNAVVNLLQSFNVDTQTIATVKAVLSGQTPPAPTGAPQGSLSGTVSGGPPGTGMMTGNGMMPPGQMAKRMCESLNRTMGPGSRGEDVRKLQEFLKENGNFDGSATGTFGPMTQDAVRKFQMQNGFASSSTGTFGPATKSFMERACGKGLGQNMPQPAIMGGFSGLITANDGASSITLKNKEGKSVTVAITASTTIMVASGTGTGPATGTIADLTVGKTASAEGPRTGDSAMTAIRIKVAPAPATAPTSATAQ